MRRPLLQFCFSIPPCLLGWGRHCCDMRTVAKWHYDTRWGPAVTAFCSLLVIDSSGCEEEVDYLNNVVLLPSGESFLLSKSSKNGIGWLYSSYSLVLCHAHRRGWKRGKRQPQKQPCLFDSLWVPHILIFWLLRLEWAENFAWKMQEEGTSHLKFLWQYRIITLQENPFY